MDVSPKKPPFSPRKSTRWTAPVDEEDSGFETVGPVLGNSLIIRSALLSGSPVTASSAVALVRAEVTRLMDTFANLPAVTVHQFSSYKLSSSCYMRVLADPADPDPTPRFDLLEIWKETLEKEKPEWDVAWQPMSDGRDKQMTVRFPDAAFKKARDDKTPCTTLEKVKAALTAQGMTITDSYSTVSSGSYLTLANHAHVDSLISDGYISLPAVSPNSITITRCRQIECLHAFEIVISGVAEGEGAQSSICRWISKQIRDPIDNSPCLVDARVPENEADCLVVWMSDWNATSRLLDTGDAFDSFFKPKIPTIHRPQLLLAYNNEGLYRPKTVSETFKAGADSMNESLKSLQAEMAEIRRETRAQHAATQLSVNALTNSVAKLHSHVDQMSTRIANQASAFLAMTTENTARSQLAQVEMVIMQYRTTLRFGDDSEKEEAQAELAQLRVQAAKLTQSLNASAGRPVALLGGSIGRVMPVPIVPPGIHLPPVPSGSRNERDPVETNVPNKRACNGLDQELPTESNMTDSVSPRACCPLNMLIATREAKILKTSVTRSTTTRVISRVSPSRVFHGVLSFPEVKDVLRYKKRALASRKNSVLPLDTKYNPPFPLLLFFLVVCSLANVVTAANSPFSMYALNMNGIGGPGKISHVNSVISFRNPHAFVITETKTNEKLSSKLPSFDYNIFEEEAVPQTGGKSHKWGVAVGIRKEIQISQRVAVTKPSLRGRLLAIDIILPTDSGLGFVHRIIGIYAPWDPGINNIDPFAREFWADVTAFCQNTTTSWTMAGDVNATVAAMERAADKSDARAQFIKFLADAQAHDLWSDVRSRDRRTCWTSRARGANGGGNIIDRIVSSKSRLVDSEIGVADRYTDFVPSTDHRAVVGKLIYSPPAACGSYTNFPEISQVFNQPRIKYPLKSEKHRFGAFRDLVERRIKAEGIHLTPVTDDDSFIRRYKALTGILIPSAENIFGRTARFKKNHSVTSPKIQAIVSLIRNLGGAVRHVKSDFSAPMSFKSRKTFNRYAAEFSLSSPSSSVSLHQYLVAARRQLYKDLYAETMAEIYARAKLQDRNRMIAALRGGSTKKLAAIGGFVSLPRSICAVDGSGKILSEPDAVMEETREYFSKLYGRLPPVNTPKPWLTTPSVIQVRQRVTADPFEWPKPATVAEFRALLRRGNQKPSPGPDQWEKWCIKALSDFALALILDLHNYIVMNSRFPGDLKDMWITMFHKRGLLTDLSNWRGLFLSNFLANSPVSWLTTRLTAYSSKMGIVPETQVAVQQGVQTRDLMSFLAGVQTWSERHKETVYALKRDQMKGFDYLSPQGFYDAVLAYGLPQSIIDLDRAAQSETQCRIRTFYGPTSPIVVSGVTKQGGPASPLKAIYTTSLGHRYLDDIAAQSPDSLLITTTNTLNADPHLPNDYSKILVTMVEATDDSFIFAKSLHAAQNFCLHMERFQFAYGWLTQWRKTYAYVLGDRDPARPDRLSFPSVSIDPGVDPWTVKHYEVPVIRTGLDFLNAKVDDPGVRFAELKDIVDAFAFPRLTGRLPVTLLRKMVAQNIISRCRALLSLQPIKQVDAEALDARISTKIHAILGMPFNPSSKILTLPVSLHGFGFPSLARINAGIVVDGIARDLNHHIAAYRAMARITLAEWTCNLHSSNCIYPLDGEGLTRSYTHYYKKIPAAWITAHGVMSGMQPPLSLRVTDHNDLLRGETSISHILALCNHHVPGRPNKPDGNTLRTLRGKGIRSLSDIGEWCTDTAGTLMFVVNPDCRPKGHWTAAQTANWKRTVDTLRLIDTRWLFSGPLDLMISRVDRRHWAEERIRALVPLCEMEPSSTSGEQQLWGSDGSMIPPSASLGEHRTVTAAVTGPATLVVQLRDRNLSILHGELMGHVLGLVLCDDTANRHRAPHLYSDHQNSVDLLDDIRCGIAEDTRLRGMNGRSLYRWILQLMRESRAVITYTRGHSAELSIESQLNREADHYASKSQRYPDLIPLAPIPSFSMDEFTFHRDPDGWIESNIRSFVDYFLASEMAQKMALGNRMRMLTWVHNTHAPPDYPYTRAVSAHSAVIQLYARSGQLPLAETLMARSKLDSNLCRLCSNAIESMHHIFVDCRKFEGWRTEAGVEVTTRTERKLLEMGIAILDQQPILHAAKSLFIDDPIIWPLKMSQYYLGQVPRTDDLITPALIPETIKRRKLSVHLASDWHTSSIRLAGRIFGSIQRTMAARAAGTTS